MLRFASRLDRIPPYPFAEMDRKRKAAVERGIKVISLAIGDPDRPTPDHVIRALCREAHRPENHVYPPYDGLKSLRQAAAEWMDRRFAVKVSPEDEVIITIGSKEAIAHVIRAYVEAGDLVLVPDPAYPVYAVQTLMAGGKTHLMPLLASNDYLPDLDAIPEQVAQQAKLMFINYPNNPTAVVADLGFYQRVIDFCRTHDILLVHDAAYSEITYDKQAAPSPLQIPGAKDHCLEIHSLSKTYNMTGWRVGFTVGCAQGVLGLSKIKENTDSGQFMAVQLAAMEALNNTPAEFHEQRNRRYKIRQEQVLDVLSAIGWKVVPPRATFYLWLPVPRDFTASSFAGWVLERAGVVLSPGTAFGAHGEGYVRMSLTVNDELLDEACRRFRTHVRYP